MEEEKKPPQEGDKKVGEGVHSNPEDNKEQMILLKTNWHDGGYSAEIAGWRGRACQGPYFPFAADGELCLGPQRPIVVAIIGGCVRSLLMGATSPVLPDKLANIVGIWKSRR